jgi:hypothetical protein
MKTTSAILLLVCVLGCDELPATSATSDGGCGTGGEPSAGSAGTGGTAGTSAGGAGEAGSTTSTSTTTTPTEPTCTDLACANAECGQASYDCDGDGEKENHLCPDTCAAPAACGGDYGDDNGCGTQCQVLPEYLALCGAGVEFACDVECGYCFKYVDGVPIYKSFGWECPVVETMGDPGPMAVRCCANGCCS